jgi:hypothetical protein
MLVKRLHFPFLPDATIQGNFATGPERFQGLQAMRHQPMSQIDCVTKLL